MLLFVYTMHFLYRSDTVTHGLDIIRFLQVDKPAYETLYTKQFRAIFSEHHFKINIFKILKVFKFINCH